MHLPTEIFVDHYVFAYRCGEDAALNWFRDSTSKGLTSYLPPMVMVSATIRRYMRRPTTITLMGETYMHNTVEHEWQDTPLAHLSPSVPREDWRGYAYE